MYRVASSRRRLTFWTQAAACAALFASTAATAAAQGDGRDTGRVYRIQTRQLTDSTYSVALRRARAQLKIRLDSLQHEFEFMSVESPDRVPRLREISALLSSIAKLTELEDVAHERALVGVRVPRQQLMVIGGDESLPGPMQLSDGALPRGWIGINIEAPHQRFVRGDTTFYRYFSYPEIVSVEPESPAERAGISRGDRLIAYDGADVRDRDINMTRLLRPSRRVTVTVRRDGEERDFPVIVARPPARLMMRMQRSLAMPDEPALAPPAPTVMPAPNVHMRLRVPTTVRVVSGNGSMPIAGASLSEIRDPELGRIFGVASGLLVTEVFSDPAQGSGLRGGDVIVGAEGQEIRRLSQLRQLISAHNDDRALDLEIVRQKRTRTVTLRW
jgi:serine protease Do